MTFQITVGFFMLTLAIALSQASEPVPPAILNQISADLHFGNEDFECLREARQRLKDISSAARIRIKPDGDRYLIRLIGHCLAGANNARLLVYVNTGNHWTLVLNAGGNRLRVLPTSNDGWHDIAVLGHLSSFEEVRTEYHFTKGRYNEVDCSVIQSENTAGKLNPPLIRPCADRSGKD